MGLKDLDAELADAIDSVEAAQRAVDEKRTELETARESLGKEKKKVREIQGEIYALVRGAASTRPIFDEANRKAANATFTDPSPATTRGRKSSPQKEAATL